MPITALVVRLDGLEGVMRLGPFFQNRWWGFWSDGWGQDVPATDRDCKSQLRCLRRPVIAAASLDFVDREVCAFFADFFGEGR